IRFPVVAERSLRARAEVAVAAGEPLASGAAAAEFLLAVAEPFQQRDVAVGPDLREPALADVADDVVLRELIGVDKSEAVARAEGHAGAVAAVAHHQVA